MFAPRHTVFIGPGKLPDELRLVLARRAGKPQPDIAIQVPRLLATFESAAEAERLASQVQRLRIGAAVAGPEQPPAEVGWAVATAFEFFDLSWRVHTSTSEAFSFSPKDITAITLVDWRPDDGAADRAVLLTLRENKPVMLRARLLDTVSAQSVPIDGMRRINEVLDAAANVLTAEVRVRSRRLNEADFRGDEQELKGDLLPLVLGVVDAVDTMPGVLPRPLQGKAPAPPHRPAHQTALAATTAWVLYLFGLAGIVASLAFFAVAAIALFATRSFGITETLIGLALGAWGTRRFMWSRWLAHANWGEHPPVPSWPIAASERGIKPTVLELLLDGTALLLVGLGCFGEGVPRGLSLWTLPFLLVGVLTSAAAVYEAWQRE